MLAKLQRFFIRNPAAWFFFGLFAFAEYANGQHVNELKEICSWVGSDQFTNTLDRTPRLAVRNVCARVFFEPDWKVPD